MPFLPLEGTEKGLFYIQTGEGPDVVLVHGLASNLAFWFAGMVLPLRQDYRVTAFDLRGHGKSDMPPTGYTHQHMADDLFQLARHLDLGPFHLISHSFGGLIGISFALRYPGDLRSLTLADVPLKSLSSTWSALWPMLPPKLAQAGISISEEEPFPELQVLEEVARCWLNGQADLETAGHAMAPYGFGKADARTLKRWLRLLQDTTAREDFRSRNVSEEELVRILVPTLVTYGSQSKWKASGDFFASCIPHLEIHYLEDAGHAHPWERPEIFLRLWQSFVASQDTAIPYKGRERRSYRRHEIRTHMELQAGDESYPVEAVNLSMSGIFVFGPQSFRVGALVSFSPPHTAGDEKHVITGQIVRRGRPSHPKHHAFGIQIPSEGHNREIMSEWIQRISENSNVESNASLVNG